LPQSKQGTERHIGMVWQFFMRAGVCVSHCVAGDAGAAGQEAPREADQGAAPALQRPQG
jgi:hypothetical protein